MQLRKINAFRPKIQARELSFFLIYVYKWHIFHIFNYTGCAIVIPLSISGCGRLSICLSNMENNNAVLINDGIDQGIVPRLPSNSLHRKSPAQCH